MNDLSSALALFFVGGYSALFVYGFGDKFIPPQMRGQLHTEQSQISNKEKLYREYFPSLFNHLDGIQEISEKEFYEEHPILDMIILQDVLSFAARTKGVNPLNQAKEIIQNWPKVEEREFLEGEVLEYAMAQLRKRIRRP